MRLLSEISFLALVLLNYYSPSMKTLYVMTILLVMAPCVTAVPLETLKKEGCQKPLESLARLFIKKNHVLLSIYEERLGVKLAIKHIRLCKSKDLDQGSSAVRRETSFCDQAGHKLTLYTVGDQYCTNEQVLGIKSMTASSKSR